MAVTQWVSQTGTSGNRCTGRLWKFMKNKKCGENRNILFALGFGKKIQDVESWLPGGVSGKCDLGGVQVPASNGLNGFGYRAYKRGGLVRRCLHWALPGNSGGHWLLAPMGKSLTQTPWGSWLRGDPAASSDVVMQREYFVHLFVHSFSEYLGVWWVGTGGPFSGGTFVRVRCGARGTDSKQINR